MNTNPLTAPDHSVQPESPAGEKFDPMDFPAAAESAESEAPALEKKAAEDAPAPPPVAPPAEPEPEVVAPMGGIGADDAKDRVFLARLEEYAEAMSPGKRMDRNEGARYQRNLYNLLIDILKSSGVDFMRRWTLLLRYVHSKGTKDNDVFGARYLHRFINNIPSFTLEERKVFMNLLHLIAWTADPKGRQQALRNIVMESVVANIPVPHASDKLLSYYAV